jgi:type IV secretory pathway component VirB8
MNQPGDELDRALSLADSYLDDAGFTEQVVARLPRRRPAWVRRAVIATFTLLAATVAVVAVPIHSLVEAIVAVDTTALGSTTFLAGAVSLIVVVWTTVSAALADG